jgi:hypothetical protein
MCAEANPSEEYMKDSGVLVLKLIWCFVKIDSLNEVKKEQKGSVIK